MQLNLEEELKQFNNEFKNLEWSNQIIILNSLDAIEFTEDDEDEVLNSQINKLLDIIRMGEEYYLDNGLEKLKIKLAQNMSETTLINGILDVITTKWKLREDSKILKSYSLDMLEFIVDEIIQKMIIRRIYSDSRILINVLEETFPDKSYDRESVLLGARLINFLVKNFYLKNYTYNYYRKFLIKETLLTEEFTNLLLDKMLENHIELTNTLLMSRISELLESE